MRIVPRWNTEGGERGKIDRWQFGWGAVAEPEGQVGDNWSIKNGASRGEEERGCEKLYWNGTSVWFGNARYWLCYVSDLLLLLHWINQPSEYLTCFPSLLEKAVYIISHFVLSHIMSWSWSRHPDIGGLWLDYPVFAKHIFIQYSPHNWWWATVAYGRNNNHPITLLSPSHTESSQSVYCHYQGTGVTITDGDRSNTTKHTAHEIYGGVDFTCLILFIPLLYPNDDNNYKQFVTNVRY